MVRAASSAMRSDTSVTRRFVSITCCRLPRTRSLCTDGHEVLHRPAADKAVEAVDVLGQALLGEAEQLMRDLLEATSHDRAGLRHSVDGLGRAARYLFGLRAREGEALQELIGRALKRLRRGI